MPECKDKSPTFHTTRPPKLEPGHAVTLLEHEKICPGYRVKTMRLPMGGVREHCGTCAKVLWMHKKEER